MYISMCSVKMHVHVMIMYMYVVHKQSTNYISLKKRVRCYAKYTGHVSIHFVFAYSYMAVTKDLSTPAW